jgi:hypothetical protein
VTYCSAKCARDAKRQKEKDRNHYGPRRHQGGRLITTAADNGLLVFTAEGLEFIKAQLLTRSTYPEIAGTLGINITTFKHLLRRTGELAAFREAHFALVGLSNHLMGGIVADTREAKCMRCDSTFTERRGKYVPPGRSTPAWTDRRWCDECVVLNRTGQLTDEDQQQDKELIWIRKAKKTLAQVRKYLRQGVSPLRARA